MTKFWFVIPLRGKAASKDWAGVCSDLKRTLASLLRQGDADFSVILSCDEVPDIDEIKDHRVTVISKPYPVPETFNDMAIDKRAKKRAALAHIAEAGGGYVMLVDADDLVHRDLVTFVREDDNRSGYLLSKGYTLYSKTLTISEISRFDAKCGTCYVVHFEPHELPRCPDDEESLSERFGNHRLAAKVAAELGKPLTPVPFAAAVYVLETGENLSSVHPDQLRFSRFTVMRMWSAILRRLRGRKPIAAEFKQSFGMA